MEKNRIIQFFINHNFIYNSDFTIIVYANYKWSKFLLILDTSKEEGARWTRETMKNLIFCLENIFCSSNSIMDNPIHVQEQRFEISLE